MNAWPSAPGRSTWNILPAPPLASEDSASGVDARKRMGQVGQRDWVSPARTEDRSRRRQRLFGISLNGARVLNSRSSARRVHVTKVLLTLVSVPVTKCPSRRHLPIAAAVACSRTARSAG
jgi:hypothetical protein